MDSYEKIKEFIEKNCLKEIAGENVDHKNLYYIYITEDLKKQNFYLGKKTCKCKNLFEEQYFGSGVVVKRIVKKCKRNSEDINSRLKKYVLQICNSKEDNTQAEIKWIDFFKASENSLFYNISLGGDGGDNVTMNPNREEIRRKNSEVHKGQKCSDKQRQRLREVNLGKKHSEESIGKMKEVKANIPQETKDKMRKSALNRDPETYNFLSEQMKGNQHFLGKKHSEESIEKMKLAKLGVKYTKESIEKRTLSRRKNFLAKKAAQAIFFLLLLENYK